MKHKRIKTYYVPSNVTVKLVNIVVKNDIKLNIIISNPISFIPNLNPTTFYVKGFDNYIYVTFTELYAGHEMSYHHYVYNVHIDFGESNTKEDMAITDEIIGIINTHFIGGLPDDTRFTTKTDS